ncbi:MAG: MlaD family protein [Pseudomonadota bacterium]
MEIRAHFVVIGAFVMITMAGLALYILYMGQAQREFDEYEVIFTERVSGLSVGAQVRFNGIQKGEVETLDIDPDNPAIVIARIHVDKDTPVKTDTKAELEPVGFTGLTIIQLVGGSADAPLLKDVSDADAPAITADMSGIGVFLEGSGDVIAQAQRIMSDENIRSIRNIITNIETLTGAFAENEEEIVAILENTSQMTSDLSSATEKLSATAESLQRLIDGDVTDAAGEAEQLVKDARALVEDLRGVVGENRDSVKLFADQGLGQVAPALAEARRLMRTLDYMLREIDRDPSAYFLGEQAPQYEAEAD